MPRLIVDQEYVAHFGYFSPTTTNTIGTVLKTLNQPFGLKRIEKGVCEYRKHCMSLEFRGDESVIGRVFNNKQMESTPNVRYYSTKDYPQLDFAVKCGITRSLALPVFQPNTWLCVGVLELLDCDQSQFFPTRLCTIAKNILQLSPLKTLLPFELQIDKSMKDEVLEEMIKALEVVCKTHLLPFAQIWIACNLQPSSTATDSTPRKRKSCYTSYSWCTIDSLLFSAVYGFKSASCAHLLSVGQGVVGNALSSHNPCFCRDLRQLPVAHYPLSHYARKFGFTACFGICLQAKNHHHYVLEFFLPPCYTSSRDRVTFLESIFTTTKNHLQGGFEICLGGGGGEESYVEVLNISMNHDEEEDSTFKIRKPIGIQPTSESSVQNKREEEVPDNVALGCLEKRADMLVDERENEVAEELCVQVSKTATNVQRSTIIIPPNEREVNLVIPEQNDMASFSSGRISSTSREETSERGYRTDSLSYEDLKIHFGKKLDDVAEILGVSRSTMKRACRENGINKWPSHKRKKDKTSPLYLKHDVNGTTEQGDGCVTVKATYGDEMIRFRLSFSSTKADLLEKVTLRLALKEGSFNMQYEDDDGDRVLIACDEDLEECIHIFKGKNTIKMLVQPVTNLAP